MNNPFGNIRAQIDLIAEMMPNLQRLQISLTDVADVDYLINRLPLVKELNKIPVERSET